MKMRPNQKVEGNKPALKWTDESVPRGSREPKNQLAKRRVIFHHINCFELVFVY